MRTRSSRRLADVDPVAFSSENQEPLDVAMDTTMDQGAEDQAVAATPLSKTQMLAQWKKTQLETPNASARKPFANRMNDQNPAAVVSGSVQKSKLAWTEQQQQQQAPLMTPSRDNNTSSRHHNAPSMNDLKARVDVIRRESILRDVRRESVMGTPMNMSLATPNRAGLASTAPTLVGELQVELPSCLDTAMACFDEENFVKECKAALGCRIRASRSAPDQQRDEAVTIIKSLRRCLKHMFSKKEALSKAAGQFEEEISQMISSLKLQTEADHSRAQTMLQTKELFREIKSDEGQALHFQERMAKLEALEANLQKSERSLESERSSVREEERKRALEEAQAQLNSSLSEVEKRESQLKKAEAELKERRLEWQAMEQEFKLVAEEAEKEKQEKKQVEEQNNFLQKKCTSLETDLVKVQEELNEARDEEFNAQQACSSLQEALENERASGLEGSEQRASDHEQKMKVLEGEFQSKKEEELKALENKMVENFSQEKEELMNDFQMDEREKLAQFEQKLEQTVEEATLKMKSTMEEKALAEVQRLTSEHSVELENALSEQSEQFHQRLLEEKDDALAEQKDQLTEQLESDLQGKLSDQKSELQDTFLVEMQSKDESFEAEKGSLEESLSEKAKEEMIAALSKQESDLRLKAQNELESSLQSQMESLQADFTKQLEKSLNEQKLSLSEMSSNELSDMLEKQKESLEAHAQEQKEKALADLGESLLAEKNSALAALQEELEQQSKQALENALNNKTCESKSAMTALEEEYAGQIRSMNFDHSEAMSKLNEELTQSAADEKARVIEMERSSAEAKLSDAKVAFELQAAKERADALGSMKESMDAALAEQIAAVEATCESAKEKALEQQKLSMEQEGGQTLAEALSKQASELSEEHSQTLQNALEEQKSGLHANAEATMLQKLEEQELQLKNSSDALKEKELSELSARMKIEMEDLLEKSESLYQEKLKDLGEKQKTLLEETLQFREDELKAEAEAAHSSAVEGLKQKLESDFQEQKNKALEELRAELSTMFEANLEKKMEELTSQLSSAQDSALQEQKQALTNEYNASKESALQEMKEDLESKFKIEKEQALEELKKELYDGTIAVLNSKIEALEQSKLQHESELDKMNVRLQGALAALQSEKEEVCSLQKQAAEITKDHLMKVEELSSSLADVKKDNLEHVSQLDILNAQLTAMKDAQSKSKKQQMEQISDASKEVEESRQQVLGLQDDIEGLKLQIKQGEDRVAVVEGQLLEAEYIRRQLHNQVQELRGNVRVFCRVRPLFKDTDASVQYIEEESMKLTAPSTNNGSLTAETKDWSFSFDKVFNDKSSQSDVFGEVSQLVQSALDGYKVCLFSYGQTGSGKTHTMLGGQGDNKGIIARSVEKIIEASSCLEKKGWKYSMEACFLEIYNETVRDLLQPGTAHSQKYSIQNPKTAGGCPFVAGVEREPVDSVEAANSLVRRASAARAVEATQMNDTSSRSHTIFMLYITGVHKDAGQKLEGCLNLVDLAGSERVSRSGAQGARLRETCAINKSLSSLGDVFTAISARQSHIPFRNSKLTHLLAPCLSGDGKTLMFVNVSPEANDAEETLCSLRFASKVNACELGARGSGAKRNLSSVTPNDATPSQTPAKKTTSAARTTTGARRVSTRPTTSTSSRMRSSSIGMSSPPKRTRVTK